MNHQWVFNLSPYLFSIHHVPWLAGFEWGLRWYSTMYLLSFFIVYLGLQHFVRKGSLTLTPDQVSTLLVYGIIGMLIGARLAYVFIYNWDFYQTHPKDILATWQGGLSFHGGIIGVCVAFFVFARKNKTPFFLITDHVVRLVPLGILLGRIGNFCNGELWGRIASSSLPWGVIFPEAGPEPRHPSQLYQSLGEGFCLFVVLWVLSLKPRHQGALSGYFLFFYSTFRFFIEYFRAADAQVQYLCFPTGTWMPLDMCPSQSFWETLTRGQELCALGMVGGLLMLGLTKKYAKNN